VFGFTRKRRRTKLSCSGWSTMSRRSTASLPSLGEVTTSQPALPSEVVADADDDRVLAARDLERGRAHVAHPGDADPVRTGRSRRDWLRARYPAGARPRRAAVPEYQSSSTVLARGPTEPATERTFFRSRGRSPAEFLSRTIDFPRDLTHEGARLLLRPGLGVVGSADLGIRQRARAGRGAPAAATRGRSHAAAASRSASVTRPRASASVTASLCRSRKWLMPALMQAAAAAGRSGKACGRSPGGADLRRRCTPGCRRRPTRRSRSGAASGGRARACH